MLQNLKCDIWIFPTEMEAPPRLDLDLMTDMHDMIYRKPSPIGQQAPPVHRDVRKVCLKSFFSVKENLWNPEMQEKFFLLSKIIWNWP